MAAYTAIDLVINQRATFQASFTIKNANGVIIDLTGYSVVAKYKRDYLAADSTAVSFDASVSTPATDGIVSIELTSTQTAALDIQTKYVYDIAITSPEGVKTRIVQGNIKVSGGVS